jgi:tripartite-type tricarboxylate transporter receptor subunit TctC
MRTLSRVATAASLCFSLLGGNAFADSYPSKPITLIVGYTPGGSVDLIARIVAPELGKRLGQSIVIENIGGAGGTIGAGKVVNAPADGYTLLLGSGSEVCIARLTNPAVPYDGTKDLAPVTLAGTQPMVLVGSKNLPAHNTAELIALARSEPDKLSYASSGVGTPLNLAGELVKQQAKVSITHIPYKGAAAMSNDLLGGQVDLAVFGLSSALSYIQSGQVNVYGVTSAKRASIVPNVPALAEDPTLKNVDMDIWFGLLAPRKTPQDVIQRLNKEMQAVLAMPETQRKLAEQGVQVVAKDPAQFGAFIQGEAAKYKTIVDAADIHS